MLFSLLTGQVQVYTCTNVNTLKNNSCSIHNILYEINYSFKTKKTINKIFNCEDFRYQSFHKKTQKGNA